MFILGMGKTISQQSDVSEDQQVARKTKDIKKLH